MSKGYLNLSDGKVKVHMHLANEILIGWGFEHLLSMSILVERLCFGNLLEVIFLSRQ